MSDAPPQNRAAQSRNVSGDDRVGKGTRPPNRQPPNRQSPTALAPSSYPVAGRPVPRDGPQNFHRPPRVVLAVPDNGAGAPWYPPGTAAPSISQPPPQYVSPALPTATTPREVDIPKSCASDRPFTSCSCDELEVEHCVRFPLTMDAMYAAIDDPGFTPLSVTKQLAPCAVLPCLWPAYAMCCSLQSLVLRDKIDLIGNVEHTKPMCTSRDCAYATFCPWCLSAQMHRELEVRGNWLRWKGVSLGYIPPIMDDDKRWGSVRTTGRLRASELSPSSVALDMLGSQHDQDSLPPVERPSTLCCGPAAYNSGHCLCGAAPRVWARMLCCCTCCWIVDEACVRPGRHRGGSDTDGAAESACLCLPCLCFLCELA